MIDNRPNNNTCEWIIDLRHASEANRKRTIDVGLKLILTVASASEGSFLSRLARIRSLRALSYTESRPASARSSSWLLNEPSPSVSPAAG
jgi:hypothetical protein